MRVLYYLMESLDTAEAMARTLQEMQGGRSDYFIVSLDRKGVRQHHLRCDCTDSEKGCGRGGRGALIGGVAGLLFTVWIAVMKPAGVELNQQAFFVVSAIIGGMGAWIGALVGLSRDDPRFLPFQNAIAAGQHLMVVNVYDVTRLQQIKRAIRHLHPDAWFEGEEISEGYVQLSKNGASSSHRA